MTYTQEIVGIRPPCKKKECIDSSPFVGDFEKPPPVVDKSPRAGAGVGDQLGDSNENTDTRDVILWFCYIMI